MAKSNVFMSWTGVTITPPSPAVAISLTEVTDVQVLDNDGLEMWQADGYKFATLCVAATGQRGVTIHSGDCYKLASLPKGTPCTVVAILKDAANGTGTGAMTITLSNAVLDNVTVNGASNKFATGQANFTAFSPDGTTDPLAIAQAS